jgi:hypothetical protein
MPTKRNGVAKTKSTELDLHDQNQQRRDDTESGLHLPGNGSHYSKAVTRIENAIRELEAGLRSATRVPDAKLTPSQISQRRDVVESLERSLAGSRELLAQMQQLLSGPFDHPRPRKN